MTFYEAAVQILTREGRPLHAREITEIALRENLLSHVGKQPELTMASRLAAMARRSHDRRLVAVEPDTFGLVDWALPVSPEALEASGLAEVHDEVEPPLRGRERHPRISKENVRVAGRGDRRRREEGERKKKRLSPLAAVVYDLLDRVGMAAPLFDVVAAARERDLVEDVGTDAVEAALVAENERREGEGKRPVFEFHEGRRVGIRGRHGVPEEGVDPLPAIAKAAEAMAEERKPQPPPPAPAVAVPAPLRGPVAQAVAEHRARTVKALRRRLAELEGPALESLAAVLLEAMGYRELRTVKRGKEGALLVARRRMGAIELKQCIRVLKGGRDARREDVAELRKELAAHGAVLGVLLSPAEASREARSEAAAPGAALVLLLTGDALADQMAEKGIGVVTRTVAVVDLDEAALRTARREGEARREDRREGVEEKPGAERPSREDRRAEARREREQRREERRKAREERRAAERAASAGPEGAAPAGGVELVPATGVPAHRPAPEAAPAGEAAPATGALPELPGAEPAREPAGEAKPGAAGALPELFPEAKPEGAEPAPEAAEARPAAEAKPEVPEPKPAVEPKPEPAEARTAAGPKPEPAEARTAAGPKPEAPEAKPADEALPVDVAAPFASATPVVTGEEPAPEPGPSDDDRDR